MAAVAEVCIPLLGAGAISPTCLWIRLLPTTPSHALPAPLLDRRSDPDRDVTLEPVQLLEGVQYRYEIVTDQSGPVSTDRPDIFSPDDDSGRAGRAKPGSRTGKLPVRIYAGGIHLGSVFLEVRSRKLNYLTEYRWMLRDVASISAGMVMERFAPTEQMFDVSSANDSEALYQRFAFLKSIVQDETVDAAYRRILAFAHA